MTFPAAAVAGMCLLGITSIVAVVTLWCHPRQWRSCLGVWVTAAVMVLYLPVRVAYHTPSSFDPVGDGFGIFAEFLGVGGVSALGHLFFVLGIVATWLDEFQARAKAARRDDQAGQE